MSEETKSPEEVTTQTTEVPEEPEQQAYIPQPRGEARVPGIDIEAIDARLAECSDYFTKHVDETDYRNLDWYLWRMQLRFAAGDDIIEVVDDAFMAARCLHERHAMHLELKPPEMFMTRRIVPVELGILSGMPMLTLEFSATFGLPLMMVLGKTAPEDIMSEAHLMTSFFRREFCADFVELTGLSAVIYAGVIAAIGRGFDDEATIGLNTYAKARDSLRGMPPKALLPKLKRYDALNTALACLCAGNFDMIGDVLAPEAEAFQEEQAKKLGKSWISPDKMPVPKYFDLSILTILALAALRGKIVELPTTGAISHYQDFIKGLTEVPERRIEVPGLDEESRKILQEAGVDPDQLGGNFVDNSFHDAKEESEAKAAALFEERQRAAQEAVRAKLAQEAAAADAERVAESEAAHEAQTEDSGDGAQKKSFANFFDSEDETDAAARRANENIFNEKPEVSEGVNKDKDFSAFFADGEEDPAAKAFEEAQADHESERENKDYSAFFSQDDAEDDSIREHVEEESEKAEDTGKNYSSFFETLDEHAIPEFDDGSKDEVQVKSYTESFFSEEHQPLSGLKMTLDPEPEPEPVAEEKPQAPSVPYEPVIEDNSPRRDFTKLFDENEPAPTIGLKMTLDEDVKTEEKPAAPKPAPIHVEPDPDAYTDEAPKRDFSKFFEEEAPVPTMQMSLDEAENEAIVKQAAANPKSNEDIVQSEAVADEETPVESASEVDYSKFFEQTDSRDEIAADAAAAEPETVDSERVDYNKFFEQSDDREMTASDAGLDHEAQLRELEAEQARKAAEKLEKQKLKLELDGTETEVKAAESYQQRMARLIAEKQAAAREQALREREEALRELEELKKAGPSAPQIEQLQLKPTESDDPDEAVEKVQNLENLQIKGFAHTGLDQIHANTRVQQEVEEDFDMHAAMAQKAWEEAQAAEAAKSDSDNKNDKKDDDDLHVVIDYTALAETKDTELAETKDTEPTETKDET